MTWADRSSWRPLLVSGLLLIIAGVWRLYDASGWDFLGCRWDPETWVRCTWVVLDAITVLDGRAHPVIMLGLSIMSPRPAVPP